MTCRSEIARDACNVFKALSVGELVESSGLLLVAPLCLQNKIIEMMDNEINIAKAGGEGYVGAKLNSLTDKVLIDNIRIISIVGRYLEHSRIYLFGSGVRKKVYISSADYMTRNTTRRIEVAAPLLDEGIKQRVIDYFNTQLSDNVKAREQLPDGTYVHVRTGEFPLDSQKHFFAEAYANAPKPTDFSTPPKRKGRTGCSLLICSRFFFGRYHVFIILCETVGKAVEQQHRLGSYRFV